MADSRAVLNPFTRKASRMRRNTRGSKWVPANNEHTTVYRSSPGKTVTCETHQSRHPSHAAHTYDRYSESQMSHGLSPPILKAAIYDHADLRDFPDAHARLPSVRSWFILRPKTHDDDEEVSPRKTKPSVRTQPESPISPLQGDPMAGRDSAVSGVEVTDFASDEKERQDSNATIFPSFPYTMKRSAAKGKDTEVVQTRNLTDFYHTAKAIYAVGPKGEGQKLWASYKRFKQAKQGQSNVNQEAVKEMLTTRRPSDAPGLSAHPPKRPPPSQIRLEPRKPMPLVEILYPRKESNMSNTSWEVPIRIAPEVRQHFDRSKPLPSVPRLQAAPNSRQQEYIDLWSKPLPSMPRSQAAISAYAGPSKPLPPVPKLQSAPKGRKDQSAKPADNPTGKGYVNTAKSAIQYSTQHLEAAQPTTTKPPLTNTKATHWWKSLTEKSSETYIPTSQSKANTDIPKPQISRPRPITALQDGRTANLATECGGVGGPGAVLPRPLSDKQKGKQKAVKPAHSPLGVHFPKHWRDKVSSPNKQKRDSDISFACAGVDEGHAAYGLGPSNWEMRPEPLFSGMRNGRVERDTKFYGPGHEVLDEYWK